MNDNIYDDDYIIINAIRILSPYKIQSSYVPEKGRQEKSVKNMVSDDEKECLWAIKKFQYKKPFTEIQKSTGLPAGTFSRIIKKCEKNGFIKIIKLPFGRGRPKYPILLPDGYKELGVQEKKFSGKGGYEHVLYQSLIKEHLSDHKPSIELFRNGKHIDVAIETNEFLLAIEVAMTSVHEQENIEKDITLAKADFVIVTCINDKILKEVRNIVSKLPKHMKNNTETCLISELLKKSPDEIINCQLKIRGI